MTRLAGLAGLALWAGTVLLLSRIRWFARPPLVERLRPYAPAPAREEALPPQHARLHLFLAQPHPQRLAQTRKAFGVGEDLAVRLERIHAPYDTAAFRVRQLGWSLAGLGAGTLVSIAARPPAAVALLLLTGSPALAFLVIEQRVGAASAHWQRRVFLELPVVTEQLAMLLAAGWSLGSALNRIAARGRGACATDLARVCARIRQGLSEIDAVREWAAIARVPALDRLVPVLALNRETTDLGRLLSEEARAIRRDVQRELIATIERRGQQVWIPVTVATLVPGVILMAIPFIEALRLYAGAS